MTAKLDRIPADPSELKIMERILINTLEETGRFLFVSNFMRFPFLKKQFKAYVKVFQKNWYYRVKVA